MLHTYMQWEIDMELKINQWKELNQTSEEQGAYKWNGQLQSEVTVRVL